MSNLLVQNIKHTNNTTAATVSSSGGVAVAGTLAVTGVHTVGNNAIYTSDGGAVTQNLVQGIAKAWLNVDNNGSFTTLDSFNLSGVVDTGQGIITPSWTNAFNTANYVGTATAGNLTSGGSSPKPYIGTYATGSYRVDLAHDAHSDADFNAMMAHGDLA